MKDKEFVYYLGEQVRRAIAGEHLLKERIPGHIPPKFPHDPGLCECRPGGPNDCTNKILETAFRSYADAYPERFW